MSRTVEQCDPAWETISGRRPSLPSPWVQVGDDRHNTVLYCKIRTEKTSLRRPRLTICPYSCCSIPAMAATPSGYHVRRQQLDFWLCHWIHHPAFNFMVSICKLALTTWPSSGRCPATRQRQVGFNTPWCYMGCWPCPLCRCKRLPVPSTTRPSSSSRGMFPARKAPRRHGVKC